MFLTYWEVSESIDPHEAARIVGRVLSSGLFPGKGVKILRFDETPDNWGVILFEAETAADVMMAVDVWRKAGAGFFKTTKTAPVVPLEEYMPVGQKLLEALAR
jgi:hypothetical protein